MKIIKTEEGSFQTFFDEANQKNKRVQMGIITLQPGDAQWIEANEKHWNYNDGDEPAVVVWMLVER